MEMETIFLVKLTALKLGWPVRPFLPQPSSAECTEEVSCRALLLMV